MWCTLKESDGKPKVNYVTVFERPGLHEFLKQLSEFADLVLFTAGLEGLLINFYNFLCLFIFLVLGGLGYPFFPNVIMCL